MKTLKIKEKEYNFKYSIKALFLFEQITHKSFELKNLLDQYLFFYCLLLSSNEDDFLTWDEFIDSLDNDPSIFKSLTELLSETQKKEELFIKEEEDSKKKKKHKN